MKQLHIFNATDWLLGYYNLIGQNGATGTSGECQARLAELELELRCGLLGKTRLAVEDRNN